VQTELARSLPSVSELCSAPRRAFPFSMKAVVCLGDNGRHATGGCPHGVVEISYRFGLYS